MAKFWAWFNLLTGFYELYVYLQRRDLSSSKDPLIRLWKEYTISDNRYLDLQSYVWNFELINLFLAVIFFCYRSRTVLFLQILNVSAYFLTLKKSNIRNSKYLLVSSFWFFIPFFILTKMKFFK